MNDRAVGLLDQYDIEVQRTRKGRGAILCDTDQGCLILKEYMGNAQRVAFQSKLLEQIREDGKVGVERILADKEGNLLVKDNDGVSYVLKTWYEGRECNIYDRAECVEAVKLLAGFHNSMEKVACDTQLPVSSPEKEYEKHNRELKKVRRFLREKGQKSWFEISLQQAFDGFLEQALDITEQWQQYSHLSKDQPECSSLCHGDYQYHNIIKSDAGCSSSNTNFPTARSVENTCRFTGTVSHEECFLFLSRNTSCKLFDDICLHIENAVI